jgi:hypothetical protein
MQKAPQNSLVHEHTTFGHLMQWPKVLTLHGCTAARESGGQFRLGFYVPVSARGTAKSALPARHFNCISHGHRTRRDLNLSDAGREPATESDSPRRIFNTS